MAITTGDPVQALHGQSSYVHSLRSPLPPLCLQQAPVEEAARLDVASRCVFLASSRAAVRNSAATLSAHGLASIPANQPQWPPRCVRSTKIDSDLRAVSITCLTVGG